MRVGCLTHLHSIFAGRNRRLPRDAVNALLSLAYSHLAKDLMIAYYAVDLGPYMASIINRTSGVWRWT